MLLRLMIFVATCALLTACGGLHVAWVLQATYNTEGAAAEATLTTKPRAAASEPLSPYRLVPPSHFPRAP